METSTKDQTNFSKNKARVLLDESDLENEPMVLDLDSYVAAITRIIKDSEPKFTIGIYGEWGTGKTTLMRNIEKTLRKDKEITVVWFNAWRYEREENYAVTALLKTIAIEIDKTGHHKELKPLIIRGLTFFGKDLLRQVGLQLLTPRGIEEFEEKILPKLEKLSQIDSDTIYFDGMRKIAEKVEEIRNKNKTIRFVIFIDDLDRCSPRKVLELFESIKVFLNIEGFVYVIGLSHETISKLISIEYKSHEFRGEDYIKKIIQIPIRMPQWIRSDIRDLLKNTINNLDPEHKNILSDEHIDLISESIDNNPREIKRFLNSVIVAYEIFKIKNIKIDELLIIQILNMKWNKLYNLLTRSDDKFRSSLWKFSKNEYSTIYSNLNQDSQSKEINKKSLLVKELSEYKDDESLWTFLYENNYLLQNIDWELYHRAIQSSKDIVINKSDEVDSMPDYLRYLTSEQTAKFNLIKMSEKIDKQLTKVNLSGLDLSNVNLSDINLSFTNFESSNLTGANLTGANLTGANLTGANLTGANLSKAFLLDTVLLDCNLTDADLKETNLKKSNYHIAYIIDPRNPNQNKPLTREIAIERGAIV